MCDKFEFSIIVPVFNGEKYIRKTIDILLAQNHDSYEIILVNDGSTDASGKICEEYANRYDNVQVIHEKNGGLSVARNTGLSQANGDYIIFCDADDYLNEDALLRLSNVINKYNPDCICYEWQYVIGDSIQPSNCLDLPTEELLSEEFIHEHILPPLLNLRKDTAHFIYDFAWNKVYKREILTSYGIQFDATRRIWEDRPFVVEYLKWCKSFCYLSDPLYNYVQMPGSLSFRYSMEFFDIILKNYHSYKAWFGNEYDFNTSYVNNYWCNSIEKMIIRSLKEKERKDEIRNNIFKTLSNSQVVSWYQNRVPQNDFEKKVNKLVAESKFAEAMREYEFIVKKQNKQEKWQQIKTRVYTIRKVFK